MTDETVDTVAEPFQNMSLNELREEMKDIDRGIVKLVARRIYVANTVAKVEAEKDLPTTDESQEGRVMERAGKNTAHFEVDSNLMKVIFRLLIEMNGVE